MSVEPTPSTQGTELLAAAAVASTFPAPAAADALARAPARQLAQLPTDELRALAEDLGLEPTRYPDGAALVAAIHAQRQAIAGFSRDALLEVIRWGRRPVPVNATAEQIAYEITRIKSMRFGGLSQRGLVVLATLRGIAASESDPVPVLIGKLRKKESLFGRLNRKRRAVLGSIVSSIVGDDKPSAEYKFLPPTPDAGPAAGTASPRPAGAPPRSAASIREDIEDSGLFGGITNRLKKTADQYLNQKLDEIEARIDRKLDEIDRRLAEWRDKEIANRIRILKITLWASVIVAIVSLIYEYVIVYFWK